MGTHISLVTIHGERWLMHKDNIKAVNYVPTPSQFVEVWQHDKVVLITSTELNENDNKPWQFMVGNTMEEIEEQLCGTIKQLV